jgi:hypothetical protein
LVEPCLGRGDACLQILGRHSGHRTLIMRSSTKLGRSKILSFRSRSDFVPEYNPRTYHVGSRNGVWPPQRGGARHKAVHDDEEQLRSPTCC